VRRTIREVTFKGSPFERGLMRGKRLSRTLRVPPAAGITGEFADSCREAAANVYPEAIEEFEGILKGGGFDREAMGAYYFARLESQVGGCTMCAVVPRLVADGRGPLVGRNYDWSVTDLRWCELQWFLPADGPRRVGYTHHWAGCADVLNERGLYVAIASLPPQSVQAPGVQWNIMVDMVSARCSRVEEAADALAKGRHLRPMSYLLADAAGGIGVAEATPDQVRLRGPVDGFVTAANAPQGGDILRDWTGEQSGYRLPEPVRLAPEDYRGDALNRARRRIARAEEMLRRAGSRVSEDTLKEMLSDHLAPICAGDHGHPDGAPWGTIWSGICAPAQREFLIAPGLPCRHPYQRFVLAYC